MIYFYDSYLRVDAMFSYFTSFPCSLLRWPLGIHDLVAMAEGQEGQNILLGLSLS
jgi:hypothetical protein